MKKIFKPISIMLIIAMTLSMIPVFPAIFDTDIALASPVEPAPIAAGTIGNNAVVEPFAMTGVEVINDRVAIIHLNNEIGSHFGMLALARANYLTYFMQVDGQWLQDTKEMPVGVGSRIYIRDDQKSFELVLGSATPDLPEPSAGNIRFNPAGGIIAFNFRDRDFIPYYYFHDEDQHMQSGDVWVRDIHDQPLTGISVAYGPQTLGAQPFLALEEARILDSRSIYVRFNQRITLTPADAGQAMSWNNNLLNGPFAAGNAANFTLGTAYNLVAAGDNPDLLLAHSFELSAHHPVSQGHGNGREFILTYNGDILAGVSYSIDWGHVNLRGLINAAGMPEANPTPRVTAVIAPLDNVPVADFNLLGAELVRSQSGREELVLTFDRPMSFTRIAEESRFRTRNAPAGAPWMAKFHDLIDENAPDTPANRSAYFQSLHETSTGMTGTVLTADDIRTILSFGGVYAGTTAGNVPFLDVFRGDNVIGYFRNNYTMVLHNQNRFQINLINANVSILDGAIVGFGTRNAWNTGTGIPAHATEPAPDRVGQLLSATNGFRNTAIVDFPIALNPTITPWADGFDPNWNQGVVITPTYALFNHNDVYFFQFDGIKDPLIGGLSGDVRHSVNLPGTRVFAPDGRQFGPGGTGGYGAMELSYVVQGRYPAYVIENKWIRTLIVPSNAARFLEFVFKPTGHDAFYTNPAATNYNITGHGSAYPPSGIGGGTFVLGWLLVWGGTFPVFDGCEHGHVWTTPFDYEIIHHSDGAVSVRHTITNDQNVPVVAGTGASFVPSSNNVHIGGDFTPFSPGLEYTIEYIIRPDSPVVDMAITVHNPAQVARTYEFYVCNTLAPGEVTEWGHGSMKHIDNNQICMVQGWPAPNVAVNLNTGEASNDRSSADVLMYSGFNFAANVPLEDYLPQWIRDRKFAGQGQTYNQVTGGVNRQHFYEWYTTRYLAGNNNLTTFSTDLNRRPQADWYGAVNLRNLEGIMRAGPDINQYTPSIKYWIWGYREMFDNLPFERQSGNAGRPYLEPWAGTGDQYFSNRAIAAGDTHHWVESYFHTFGLDMATNANENAMAHIKFYCEGMAGLVRPVVEIYDTKLLQQVTARMTAGGNVQTWTYTSQIMAHEVFESSVQVAEDGVRVTVELFLGNSASGTPFFTAWAYSGRPFVRIGSVPAYRGPNGDNIDYWTDRESPVEQVFISHGTSIDIPGRVPAEGNVQYRLREVFAWAEPFSADGKGILIWSQDRGDVGEVTITSGVNNPGHVINSNGPRGTPNNTVSTWWHTFDFITLRGHEPGSTVVLRATAKDENIAVPNSIYAEITVNVRQPLYLTVPYNPGNTAGTTPGHALARNMYSPYRFNMDMNLLLTIGHHHLDDIQGPITVSIYDRNHGVAEPFITFNDLEIGENLLYIPAYTFPREEFYRIVARSADGQAFGFEFFRVDGYSDIDWNRTLFVSGSDVIVRFEKKNASVLNTLLLASGATAFVNDTEFSVSVGTDTAAATSNTNTLIISGGAAVLTEGVNFVEVLGIRLPDYPHYEAFTISDTLTR